MPGPGSEYPAAMRALLESIRASDRLLETTLNWPTPDLSVSIRDAVRPLGKCGLIRRMGRHSVALTSNAEHWLKSNDNDYLAATLHANIKFFGEILAQLAQSEDGLSHEELADVANGLYDMQWNSLDQIRKRTTWLRSVGLIELRFDRKLILRQIGTKLLALLLIEPPIEKVASGSVSVLPDIPAPSPVIAEILAGLDDETLGTRKLVIGYVPTCQGGDIVDSLRVLTSGFVPEATRQEFEKLCADHFQIKESSAAAALTALVACGLIEQIGPAKYRASAPGLAWIRGGQDRDLIRLIRWRVAYWRRLAGRRYRPSPLGIALRGALPLLEPVARIRAEKEIEEAASSRESADSLSSRLIEAATDGANPERLEHVVCDVLNYLGLDAVHLGGSGRTDILVRYQEAPGRERRVIVDAKAATSGVVEERQVNFDNLNLHKEKHEADVIAVVGATFGGRIPEFARKRNAVLIETEFLAEVVGQHERASLGIAEIATLFNPGFDCPARFRLAWAEAERMRSLFTHVVAALAREVRDYDEVTKGALTLLETSVLGVVRRTGERHMAVEHPEVIARRLRALAHAAENAACLLE